jgi:hypothetical protein
MQQKGNQKDFGFCEKERERVSLQGGTSFMDYGVFLVFMRRDFVHLEPSSL